jgi:hypothetical protein
LDKEKTAMLLCEDDPSANRFFSGRLQRFKKNNSQVYKTGQKPAMR